jgi:ribose-phosphate pyrophosphokinase
MTKILFYTPAYKYLAQKILKDCPSLEEGILESKIFPDGEAYHRIISDVSEKEVIIIAGTISDADTIALYDMATACTQFKAVKTKIFIPFYGYSTMERAVKSGEIVKAKTRAILLSSIPKPESGIEIYMFDLHSEGIPYYFENNIKTFHIYAKPLIVEAALSLAANEPFVLASTDAGRAKWVESLANDMHTTAAFILKRRINDSLTEVADISADVAGKIVIIYDDIIRTGGSLIKAAEAYSTKGAKKIFVIATHGVFCNNSLEKIFASGYISAISVTDSHPNAQAIKHPQVNVFSLASIIESVL